MALDKFIGQVWANSLMLGLSRSVVWAQEGVVNRSYEGAIKGVGDTVNINDIGDITVVDYTKYTSLGAPQVLTSTQKQLVINQAKAFNFIVDSVERVQGAEKAMGAAVAKAVNALKKQAETYLASTAVAGTNASNVLGTSGTPIDVSGSGAAYDQLVELGVLLDEADAPEDGRWVIASPAFVAKLTKDSRFNQNSEDTVRNGFSGQAAGFTVLKSNNAATGAAVAGYGDAIAFAEAIPADTVEALRSQDQFGDIVRGLHLYGAKVVNDKGLAVVYHNAG